MVKLQINFEKKHLFVLLILAGVILAGFVLAQTYQNPQTGVGHNYNELQPCPANQILKSDGNVWTCVNIPAAGGSFWQDGGSGRIYYNGGNVGIGTPSPEYKLDVGSNARVQGDLIVDGTIGSADGSLVLNGNVGIGTTPGAKLDVAGTIGSVKITDDSSIEVHRNNEGTGGYIDLKTLSSEDYDARLYASGNDFRIKMSGSGDALTILNNGNVGIGKSPSTYKLEVAGVIKADSIIITGGDVMFAEPGTDTGIQHIADGNLILLADSGLNTGKVSVKAGAFYLPSWETKPYDCGAVFEGAMYFDTSIPPAQYGGSHTIKLPCVCIKWGPTSSGWKWAPFGDESKVCD